MGRAEEEEEEEEEECSSAIQQEELPFSCLQNPRSQKLCDTALPSHSRLLGSLTCHLTITIRIETVKRQGKSFHKQVKSDSRSLRPFARSWMVCLGVHWGAPSSQGSGPCLDNSFLCDVRILARRAAVGCYKAAFWQARAGSQTSRLACCPRPHSQPCSLPTRGPGTSTHLRRSALDMMQVQGREWALLERMVVVAAAAVAVGCETKETCQQQY